MREGLSDAYTNERLNSSLHRWKKKIANIEKKMKMACVSHAVEADDVQVDIDSFEDGDVQSLRDSLHWEASPPVDSTTTSSSNGSRRRGGPNSKPIKAPVTKKKKVVKQSNASSSSTASSNHPSNNPVGASLYDFV